MNNESQRALLENQRLIWSLANKYATIRIPAEELFQIGCVKACRCLDEYDTTSGSITNFLYDRLRGVMLHAVNKQYTLDNREVSGNSTIFMENQSDDRRENSNRGAAKRKVYMYNDCEDINTQVVYSLTLENANRNTTYNTTSLSNIIRYMVFDRTLTTTEYLIVRWIFWNEKTHRQVGDLLGISKGRVTQLRKRALQKIRRRLEYIDGTKPNQANGTAAEACRKEHKSGV